MPLPFAPVPWDVHRSAHHAKLLCYNHHLPQLVTDKIAWRNKGQTPSHTDIIVIKLSRKKQKAFALKKNQESYPTPFSQQANRHHCCSLHVSSRLHLSVNMDGQAVVALKARHVSSLRSLSGLKTSLAYAIGKKTTEAVANLWLIKAHFRKSNALCCPSTTNLSCSCNLHNKHCLDQEVHCT